MYREFKQLNLPALDAEILQFWQENRIFEQSVEQRDPENSFVFYEGPPSANGKPGIHHVMARTVKDLFCRYHTLKGRRVERKGGWDTHGLPIELQVEKELGITKEDIGKKISVDDYNHACRETVMRFKDLWDDITRKMGMWVDLDDPYITFKNEYIESVWNLLQILYNKRTPAGDSYLYKGFTIQPYSPAAGTGLSTHELNMPGCYQDVTDQSVIAMFKVTRDEKSAFLFDSEREDVRILAWTTTPWTLPSNVALTVGPDIQYVKVKTFSPYTGEKISVILAKERLEAYFPKADDALKFADYKLGDKKIPYNVDMASIRGADLLDIRYEQLLPSPALLTPELAEKGFRVIGGDWVTTTDGTGVVHTAPYFGADDFRACKAAGVPFIGLPNEKQPDLPFPLVDKQGRFAEEVPIFGGRFVKEQYFSESERAEKDFKSTDLLICLHLKEQNKAFRTEKYKHTYPHCWRTNKPVLYYPLDSWFVRASAAKERMSELNNTINWKPAHTGTGRFGEWLKNLQDWNLSRSRYWGVPLPIWRTEDSSEEICIGSVADLQREIEKANTALGLEQSIPKDFHRPYIDEIVLVSASGTPMRRELDLIDVWFDSGSMPYAQWHYPFENQEVFKNNFPADFIAEGVDQTRGWFYTLHAIAVMCFDSVAFKNVVSNGLVQDKLGRKMSKSLGNATDPFETLATYGADATRWYMMANANPWDNLKFDADGILEVRNKLFGTLYNTYNFFATYANLDRFAMDEQNVMPYAERTELDRWVISKLYSLVAEVRAAMDDYDVTRACRAIETFVDEHLSNWYVRLGRRRFWRGEMSADKTAAYQTLFECLMVTGQLMSPVAPFFTDWLYQNLTAPIREKAKANHTPLRHESVHLTDLTAEAAEKIDFDLEKRMDYAQRICSLALSIRKKEKIRVRQPLQKILLPVLDAAFIAEVDGVKDLILSEINVKSLEYVTDSSGLIKKKAKANFKTLGAKLGKDMKVVADMIGNFSNEDINALEKTGQMDISANGNAYTLSPEDLLVTTEDLPGWKVASDTDLTVALDVTLNDDLLAEGMARDLINRIQTIRKEQDFNVTDRVVVRLERHPAILAAVGAFGEYIQREVLATELVWVDDFSGERVEMEEGVFVGIGVEMAPAVLRLWNFISFNNEWKNCDTSKIEDLAASWFARREKLKDNSQEYKDFLNHIKREHAIETGIIERMYDLSKGVTETFIKEGFYSAFVSHGDANIETGLLMNHLNDHLEAVDFVFDTVKNERPFSVSFIKQLHQLVTRHQDNAEGRDQHGNKLKIPLLRGAFKIQENNPTRADGTKILYCPPEHVVAEMDNLVSIYEQLEKEGVHPAIIAAWIHHAFSIIHPFQDGNGRVARLLTSLILIKGGYFPFTVVREEAKVKYIHALEEADQQKPQALVTYICEVQKHNIQKVLNLKDVVATSFESTQEALISKIRAHKKQAQQRVQTLQAGRSAIFEYCERYLTEIEKNWKTKFGNDVVITLRPCGFEDTRTYARSKVKYTEFFYRQIVQLAQKHDYFFNRNLPKAWFALGFKFSKTLEYELVITIHHFGYEDSALAIGAFLQYKDEENGQPAASDVLPMAISPHHVSIYNGVEHRERNIRLYLEQVLTTAMAQMASGL